MKQIGYVIGILLLSTVAATVVASDDEGITASLRRAVENNLTAYNQEDAPATMTSIHSKSPEYAATRQALPAQFNALDARTELLGLHYLGHDDEFAVARVKLKTVNRSDAPFAGNVVDTITIFHQEDGVWKYWSNYILGVELVQ